MLLYCKKCNNLIGKSEESRDNGEVMIRICSKCGEGNRFYVKYEAVRDNNERILKRSQYRAIIDR